jgi:hypothetical protein
VCWIGPGGELKAHYMPLVYGYRFCYMSRYLFNWSHEGSKYSLSNSMPKRNILSWLLFLFTITFWGEAGIMVLGNWAVCGKPSPAHGLLSARICINCSQSRPWFSWTRHAEKSCKKKHGFSRLWLVTASCRNTRRDLQINGLMEQELV